MSGEGIAVRRPRRAPRSRSSPAAGDRRTTGPSATTPASVDNVLPIQVSSGPAKQHRERPLRERHDLRAGDLQLPDDRRRPGRHRIGRPSPAVLRGQPVAPDGRRRQRPSHRELRHATRTSPTPGGRWSPPTCSWPGRRPPRCPSRSSAARAFRVAPSACSNGGDGGRHRRRARRPRSPRPRRLPPGLRTRVQRRPGLAAAGVLQLLRRRLLGDRGAADEAAPEPGLDVRPGRQRPSRLAAGGPPERSARRHGSVVFGIGTQGNNALGAARVYTTNGEGNISTRLQGARPTPAATSTPARTGLSSLDASTIGLPPLSERRPASPAPRSTVTFTPRTPGMNGTSRPVSFSRGERRVAVQDRQHGV